MLPDKFKKQYEHIKLDHLCDGFGDIIWYSAADITDCVVKGTALRRIGMRCAFVPIDDEAGV